MSHNPFLQSRPRSMITGYHGTTISVEPKTREGLYICNSNEASITITKKCAKAGIEACNNLSVYFNAPVMTEMLEIVSSNDVDIYISRAVTLRTITIDMCRNVNIHVQNAANQLFKVYYHQSSDTRIVKHEGGPVQRIELDTLPTRNEQQTKQYVCRVHDDGQVQVDPVVREGKGYPTTEEEIAEHEANEEIMLRYFRDQIYLLAGLDDIAAAEDEDDAPSGSNPHPTFSSLTEPSDITVYTQSEPGDITVYTQPGSQPSFPPTHREKVPSK